MRYLLLSCGTALTALASPSVSFGTINDSCSNDLHFFQRSVLAVRLDKPHPLHNLHSTLHAAKNGVLPIKPRRWRKGDEELTSICVLSAVGHAQHACASVLQGRTDLVGELFSIDARAASTGTRGITTLDHEVWDNAVEDDIIVVAALGEGRKVLAGLGGMVVVELDRDGTLRLLSAQRPNNQATELQILTIVVSSTTSIPILNLPAQLVGLYFYGVKPACRSEEFAGFGEMEVVARLGAVSPQSSSLTTSLSPPDLHRACRGPGWRLRGAIL